MILLSDMYYEDFENFIDFVDDSELYIIARDLYKKEFEEFCKDEEFPEGTTEKGKFVTFVEETLIDAEQETLTEILEMFAKRRGWKATICDAYMRSDGYHWVLKIFQVTPHSKEDLVELFEVFAENNDVALPEVFVDGAMDKLGL